MQLNEAEIGSYLEKSLSSFKRDPREHQLKALQSSLTKSYYALLMDRGTGKTKVCIDSFSLLYKEDQINAVLIIAPNEVHRRWITEHLPKDLHSDLKAVSVVWDSSKSSKKYYAELKKLLDPRNNSLKIFSINVEGIIFEKARLFLRKYLKENRVFTIIDESTRIKTPGVKRTKAAIGIGKLSKYRRILTGNEITNSPFDVYSQYRFLNPNFWGGMSFFLFKHNFGEFREEYTYRKGKKVTYEALVKYQNMADLKKAVEPFSFRAKKAECLDLPPKIYETIPVEMNKDQRRLYDELKEELFTIYKDQDVEVINKISLTTRHRQITGGFFPKSNQEIGDNPKIKALLYDLEDVDEEAIIIWACFSAEIEALYKALKKLSDKTVMFYGKTSRKDRLEYIDAFQRGEIRFFIANPEVAGTGLNLQRSTLHYFYSNSFKPEPRWQAEDRSHRDGQHWPVLYKDLVCVNSIDETVVEALKSKTSLSEILQRPLSELL